MVKRKQFKNKKEVKIHHLAAQAARATAAPSRKWHQVNQNHINLKEQAWQTTPEEGAQCSPKLRRNWRELFIERKRENNKKRGIS